MRSVYYLFSINLFYHATKIAINIYCTDTMFPGFFKNNNITIYKLRKATKREGKKGKNLMEGKNNYLKFSYFFKNKVKELK